MLPARTTILALTTITLITISGCGGSTKTNTSTVTADTSPTTTTTATTATGETTTHPFPVTDVKIAVGKPLAHQQWVKKADAICAHYRTELKHIKIKGLDELPRVLPQETAYLRSETAHLAKLIPPTTNKNDWQQILNTILELAEGSTKVAEINNAGNKILQTPTGLAFVATSHHLIELTTQNKLPNCAI